MNPPARGSGSEASGPSQPRSSFASSSAHDGFRSASEASPVSDVRGPSSAQSRISSSTHQPNTTQAPGPSFDFPMHHMPLSRPSIAAPGLNFEQRRRSSPITPSNVGIGDRQTPTQSPRQRVSSNARPESPMLQQLLAEQHRPSPSHRSTSDASRSAATAAAAVAAASAPDRSGPSVSALGHYQLGDCLGRGAFGSVYRGLNWMTGETVAVKQIQLGNIPKSELGEIMSEIDLLKNLNHPNIVKYKGSEKTKEFLYIILEYCENGSLHHICKRFGKFPEGLVSVYISQVLEGLIYLHDQGVIHRDIKGANILTTKDGSVKLADFGVATKTGAMSDYAVVGSPYWMAPEVIDQSGATTASDIWSVGCVVVELLEGKPPYHFLAPMPALFRIVQDDCPPLPEGASPVVKDFLLHCFQKDANLRVSARKLLRHPWMISARKQLEQLKTGGSIKAGGSLKRTTHEEAVKSVQEWNQALEKPLKSAVPRGQEPDTVRASHQPSLRRVTANIADLGTAKPLARKNRSGARPTLPLDFSPPSTAHGNVNDLTVRTTSKLSALATGSAAGLAQDAPGKIQSANSAATSRVPIAGATPATSLMDQRTKLADLQKAEEQTDNWDDDFEEGITTTKLAALEKNTAAELEPKIVPPTSSTGIDKAGFVAPDGSTTVKLQAVNNKLTSQPLSLRGTPEPDFDQRTIRPPSGPQLRSVSSSPQVGTPKTPSGILASFRADEGDDYSDLVAEEDDLRLNERIQNLQMQNSVGKRLFHPNDLRRLSNQARPESTSSPRLADRRKQSSSEAVRSVTASGRGPLSNPSSPQATLKMEKGEKWKQMRRALGKYSEDDSAEDYSDLFGKTESGARDDSVFSSGSTLQLTARLSNRSWLRDDDLDEDDPFAEIDEGFDAEADLEANVARDQHARMCAFVTELVDSLNADGSEDELLQVCEDIDQVLTDMPEMKAQLLSSHGALALIQLLEIAKDRELVTRLLGILNLIIFEDAEAQENLCLIGAIPVVITFTTKKWPHDLRLEAAHFVFAMCSTSRLTLQFVLSCRGLRTLVNLIDEDYHEQKDLVWIGIGCVSSVLELQSPASRNDFCRMLAQEGLLEPLSSALQCVLEDSEDDYAIEARANILQIFLIYSQSDGFLKKQVATRSVLRRVLQTASKLEPESLTLMLKIVKNLSMSPTILDEMQNANTIEILTNILARHHSGPHGTEMSNQVLNTMYNLCRLSKSRQEEAAQAGIIPQLLRVARTNSPLKQFALPILCDFAHAGKATRKMFWQHKGLNFYLKLLEDPYWQVSALESILVWLQDETARVEEVLLQASSIDSLLCVFATSKANSFENLLEPLLKVCRLSTGIVAAFANNSIFIKKLIERLSHPKAVVRLNLLRITKMICDLPSERSTLIDQYKVYDLVEKLSKQDGAVLVRELARDIASQRYVERESPRTVRRTMSETHVGGGGDHRANSGNAMPPPTQISGTRASAAYRRKISGGSGEGGDMIASSIANHIIHERSTTGSFSPSPSPSPSSSAASRSSAMRNLVGKLGQQSSHSQAQPRRSITPNRDVSRSSTPSPRIPLDQLPEVHLAGRDRKNSQPPLSGASGEHGMSGGLKKAPMRAQSPLLAGLRTSRSVSHDIASRTNASTPPTTDHLPGRTESSSSSNSATKGISLEDKADRDRTMRPASRRPIPSLPSSHRFPSS